MLDNTRPPGSGKVPPTARGKLRLVHPITPQKQGDSNKPRGRHRRLNPFTPDEQARLRAALKHARALFGTWACLADAMRVASKTPHDAASGRKRVSGDLAVRLARALGKPLEALLRAPADASVCQNCGRST